MSMDQMDVDNYEYRDGELRLKSDDPEMSFLDHLEELRWHIIRSIAAIAVGGIVLFLFYDWYFDHVLLGPTHQEFISYKWFCDFSKWLNLGDALCFVLPAFDPIATDLAETFIVAIKMSFVGGFVLAFPYVFYEIWRFVRPGLHEVEQKNARGAVLICSVLFLTGVCFGYFIIAPFAINFLLNFTITGVAITPTISSAIKYMTMFTLPSGVIFELPVVIYFLSKLGLVTPESMRLYRRHAVIGILVVASILTPPDVVTQFLIGIPLYLLYEISIFISARVVKKMDEESI